MYGAHTRICNVCKLVATFLQGYETPQPIGRTGGPVYSMAEPETYIEILPYLRNCFADVQSPAPHTQCILYSTSGFCL